MNIEYYVAPYEADAQLVYLLKIKKADVIITEDSDLIIYGASRICYKLDKSGDGGQEIKSEEFKEINNEQYNFSNFESLDDLINISILSGCDYLPRIKNLGFKTAYNQYISNNKNIDNTIKSLKQSNKTITLPTDYKEKFNKAFLTFKFQTVYCPIKKQQISLNTKENSVYENILNLYEDHNFMGK